MIILFKILITNLLQSIYLILLIFYYIRSLVLGKTRVTDNVALVNLLRAPVLSAILGGHYVCLWPKFRSNVFANATLTSNYLSIIFIAIFKQTFLKLKSKNFHQKNLPTFARLKNDVVIGNIIKKKGYSSTIIANKISLHQCRRHYPANGRPILIATASTINKQVALMQSNWLFNKTIFFRYCEHFENLTLQELLNDQKFIKVMSKMVTDAPSLHTRAFQLALEVTYSRRKFSLEALQEYFLADFKIKDVYDSNRGLCEQSTIYSSILMHFVKSQLQLNATSIQVNVTPLYLPKQKSFIVEQHMANNWAITGNRSPDAAISGIPYDFKESSDVSFNKNHIYIIDIATLEEKSHLLANKMMQSLQSTLDVTPDEAIKIYTKQLLFIAKTKGSFIEKIDIINKLMVNNPPPVGFRFPFLISKPHVSLEDFATPLEKLEKIPLDQGHLDYTKARKALLGILEEKPKGVQCGIELATHHSIQFPNLHADDQPI